MRQSCPIVSNFPGIAIVDPPGCDITLNVLVSFEKVELFRHLLNSADVNPLQRRKADIDRLSAPIRHSVCAHEP